LSQFYEIMALAQLNGTFYTSLYMKALLSNVVASLVRKNLIDKASYSKDQRQRVLIITDLGTKLWEGFPLHTTRHGVPPDAPPLVQDTMPSGMHLLPGRFQGIQAAGQDG
jgi:hypothetical protein